MKHTFVVFDKGEIIVHKGYWWIPNTDYKYSKNAIACCVHNTVHEHPEDAIDVFEPTYWYRISNSKEIDDNYVPISSIDWEIVPIEEISEEFKLSVLLLVG